MDHWYLLMSKPRKELQLERQLAQKGIEVYLPVLPAPGTAAPASSRRRQPRARPLFPRYLFAHLDLQHVPPEVLRWTPGLAQFVAFGGELATVDEALIAHVRQRLSEMGQAQAAPFQPGQHLRFRSDYALAAGHPLREIDVVFERALSGGQRARVLLCVLGRVMRCEVDTQYLEAQDPW